MTRPYPEEYTTDLSITCRYCDKEFDTEVDVADDYYETKCPHCNEMTYGYVE